jgi:predicted alpha/beta-fold hydrolase
VRGQANREEAILFLDHFIDLGMLRSLLVSATLRATERSFNSHEFASVRKEKLKEWVKSLRMIIEFDQKYTSKLQGFIGTLGKIKK